jgi:hypothetical protein
MATVERLRPQLGDVVEIPTSIGFAYAQYTHKHAQYGSLIRVLPGTYQARPLDFAALVPQNPQFITFFPLGAACHRKIVSVVANELIPADAQAFPVFRTSVRGPQGHGPWWLWDGVKEWRIGPLAKGMESLPIRGVVNDTLLIDRIVAGWCHEVDV